ncbi:hypothetical protein CF328_g7778 [Tilletia controversa]|nr:hypothetical protein CF328_g7778 [Tilletia controversa]
MPGASSSSSAAPAPVHILKAHAFTAQVLDSAGKPMQFYGVVQEKNFVQAFIEATDGEQFSLKLDTADRPSNWPIAIKDRNISKTEAQSLMFSKATVTDEEKDSIRDPAEVALLGEIHIEIKKVTSTRPCQTDRFSESPIGPQKAIYEKAKKVGSVQFGTGPTFNKTINSRHVVPTYDNSFTPIDFKIHCATRVGLQLRNFIPKDEDESKPKQKKKRTREEEEEDAAEAERLQKKLEEIRRRQRGEEQEEEDEGSADPHDSSLPADGIAMGVKKERTKFDFSAGGTPVDPFDLTYLSD